jgi:3-(3-hydroxy-phenyl)propionate hydroxylase
MTKPTYDVAIVGAGPTGLTLANILGQMGVSTLLIERNAATVREPRAVSIDDETLRTMQGIGLIDQVLADVALDYGSYYFAPNGKKFAAVAPTTREYGFPRRNAFTQPKLEATLHEGLSRFPTITTLFDTICDSFADEATHVDVVLVDAQGASTLVSARYLVGCDGARSAIRRAIGSTLGGSTYDQRWLIVDLAATSERLRQTRVGCNPARPFLTLPGPAGIRRYEFMLMPGETDEEASTLAFATRLLADNGPDAAAPIVRRQVYAFHARIVDKWRVGRVFLAGDAAHLSPPFAGQGMNSGIRDAQNLGWKLGAVVRGDLGEGVLDSYGTERAPHAKALIQLAINMGRVMMPRSALQAWLIEAFFRATKLLPRLQAYFAQMKYKPKPFYRDGFLAADRFGLAITGRMLPQPRVETAGGRTMLLDDLLGRGFALVAYGPNAQATLAGLDMGMAWMRRVALLPSDMNPDPASSEGIWARDAGQLFETFLSGAHDLVMLVRPDRYIAVAAPVHARAAFAEAVRALVTSAGPPLAVDRSAGIEVVVRSGSTK